MTESSGSVRATMLNWSAPSGGDHRIAVEASDDGWHVVKEYRHGEDDDWREDWSMAADPDTGVFSHPRLRRIVDGRDTCMAVGCSDRPVEVHVPIDENGAGFGEHALCGFHSRQTENKVRDLHTDR